MSWDIFVQDLPQEAKSVTDIPSTFRPASLGSRPGLIDRIKEVFPTADFSDPSWGLIEGENWSIELNIGREEECRGFTLHVRGGNPAAGAVAAILQHLNLRALDSQTGGFFTADTEAIQSFEEWREYRDKVLGNVPERR
jgi:hypothetical protein